MKAGEVYCFALTLCADTSLAVTGGAGATSCGRGERTRRAEVRKQTSVCCMKRLLLIGVFEVILILTLVRTGFALDGREPVSYDFTKLLRDLTELTDWPVADWPTPQIMQVPSEAFQGWTQLNRRSYFGQYDAEGNRVFLNLDCLCKFPEYPGAYCQAVLFHELVHWGQYHSGMDQEMSGTEQERQAMDYEKRYAKNTLGVPDLYPPAYPNRAELPQLMMPIRLIGPPLRVSVQDVAGQRRGLWMRTGRWIEAHTMNRFEGQVFHHGGHWVGVQIFQVHPSEGRQLVEAWWDEGYLPPRRGATPDTAFPVDPVYRARWVKVR